ncbi:cobalamin-dependent protein, partial [bacterium]|nr:cobalamin-dependent protein [bacterium]
MHHLLLWNSISPRKRSPSDIFLENGIGILVKNCKDAGYSVRVEDWATVDFYTRISPKVLTKIHRYIYSRLLQTDKGKGTTFINKLYALVTLVSQKALDVFHTVRMNRYLTKLAKEISEDNIPVVGIKVWYGDGFKWSKKFVEKVNKYSPETITLAGGPQPTIYGTYFLYHSNFDLAVVSEGESAILV